MREFRFSPIRALVALLALTAAASGAPLTNPPTTRERIDLGGVWEIRPDGATGDAEEGWRPIVVPASWETALGLEFDGIAVYRKSFRVPESAAGRRVLVRFLGAATEARVFVDGREIGGHVGAWTPFTLDATDAVRPGETAQIVVRLDEKVGHNTQGFLPILAPHFGGLWRAVEVILAPTVRLDDGAIRIDATHVGDDGRGARVEASIPIVGTIPSGVRVRFSVVPASEGAGTVEAEGEGTIEGGVARWSGRGDFALWGPDDPSLHELRIELLDAGGAPIDAAVRRFGFRRAEARGAAILVNGEPLVVRGILAWGYAPPSLAPTFEPERFRTQLRTLRSWGFNLVKFCLWFPPEELLDIADEEGMLTWIEYPTWHPRLDEAHREELLREYSEMTAVDGSHPSVILRSLTCETGPSADLEVIRALWDLVKERCPGTLVEDDSSWIGWNRIHDFWDDHAYGNNATWRAVLAGLQQHRIDHGMQPLLLGEAIAADTWIDSGRMAMACTGGRPWWAPRWFGNLLEFEGGLEARFAAPGFSPVADLRATSLRYAMAMRRFQIETFREVLPDAGYVVSTLRDTPLCAMGLFDDFDEPKWNETAWGWHATGAIALPTPGDARAFRCDGGGLPEAWEEIEGIEVPDLPRSVDRPTRLRVTRRTNGAGSPSEPGRRTPPWEIWALPALAPVPEGWVLYGDPGEREPDRLFPGVARIEAGTPLPGDVRGVVASALDAPLLAWLEKGGRVFHLTSSLAGSFRADGIWFLRGTAWSPPEPREFFARVPREMLPLLQLHELERGAVVRADRLWDEVDPLLAFLETHDLDRVRPNLLLFATRAGKGRLAVSALRHEGGEAENYAGVWLARELAAWLDAGSAPTRALSNATIEALRLGLAADVIRVEGTWCFRRDPEARGIADGWASRDLDDAGWATITPATADEAEAWRGYDGWGWYRRWVEIPEGWRGKRVRIVFESVDDMYELYVNGRLAGGEGKIDRSETSYQKRTWVDVGPLLEPGARNLFAVRVYDWVGAAGLNGEMRLTTGPVEPDLDLLRR